MVIQHHVLTDTQLNKAVVITRSTSGPVGLYVVSIGYFVAGVPGAIASGLAMITPAMLIIPMLHFARPQIEHPEVKTALNTVVIASAGLLLAAAIPLAKDALTDPVTIANATVSPVVLLTTKLAMVDPGRGLGDAYCCGVAVSPSLIAAGRTIIALKTGIRNSPL